MKKIVSTLLSFTLVISTLAFATPSKKALASELTYNSDNFRIITDTEERSEYIVKVDGQEIHYIETVKIVDEDTQEIETKVFNKETNELLQHFATVVEDDKIIEQDVIDFKDLSQQEDSIMFNHTNFAATNFTNSRFASSAYITSNRSLVSVLGISYTTNYIRNIGYADYANLKTRTVNLTTGSPKDRNAYNYYTRNVDSLRSTENGTLVGWFISAFSGGGLTVGTLLSWKTVQIILKNIAGPVALAANAWAIGQWFYYYNNCVNGFYNIPR